MSIENPYDISGSWKIDPDGRQDRSSGPCISRTMTKAEKIKYGMTVESEDDMKITKETVRQMAASGMSTAEIAEHFLPAYPNMKKQLMMAKVTMLLSDKKPGRQKVDTAEIVKNMLYVKHTTQSISNELQAAINSHEEHPVEHTSIKEVAEAAKKQVDNTAQESADKIKLSQAVDEMMEMVPDSRKPVKYYIATGYSHKERAKQLADVIKTVGRKITCEWWLDDESGDIAELAEIGRKEFQGIRDCDVLVCLLPGYQGTHSELGAAVILGKKVIIHDVGGRIAEPMVPCYYQDNVKWILGSELQLVAELLKETAWVGSDNKNNAKEKEGVCNGKTLL